MSAVGLDQPHETRLRRTADYPVIPDLGDGARARGDAFGGSSRVAFLTRLPMHQLLFAAYAVLYLYSANLDEVLPVDAAAPLARAVVAAAA